MARALLALLLVACHSSPGDGTMHNPDGSLYNSDGSLSGALDLAIAPGSDLGTRDLGNRLYGDLAIPSPSCTGMAITKSGALNFDIQTVTLTGQVTVDGVAKFEAIEFVSTRSARAADPTFPDPAMGSYSVNLAPDTYDVYDRDLTHPGRLMTGVVITSASTTLDIAVVTAVVAGKLTVNGAPSTKDEGSIVFTAADGTTVSFAMKSGAYGGAPYGVLAGTYDISWAPGDTCTATPCVGGVLQKGVMYTDATTIDLDLPMVTVSGNISINGADRNAADGGAPFFALQGGTTAQLTLLKGVVNYAVNLLPGTYDIGWQGTPDACGYSPCNRAVFMPGVSITTTKSLDLPVPMIAVSGAMTVNQVPLPDPENNCGSVTVGGLPIVTGSGGRFQVNLLPGSYDIAWAAGNVFSGGCPSVPYNSGTVLHKSLTASTTLDVDIPMVTVSGQGTLNGMAPQTAVITVATFTPVGAPSSAAARVYLADTYTVNLIPGVFDVGVTNEGSDCHVGTPCNDARLLVDQVFTTSRTVDIDLPMITMSGTVTFNGQPFPANDPAEILLQPVTGGNPAVIKLPALPYAVSLVPGAFTATYLPYPSSNCVFDGTPCTAEALIDCK